MKSLQFLFGVVFFCTIAASGSSQQTPACFTSSTQNEESGPAEEAFNPCAFPDFFADYAQMPTLKIRVNIHCYAWPDGSNLSPSAALALVNTLLNGANNQLANLPQNGELGNTGQPIPHVTDAKWRFELYTNPSENPDDIYGGIFFHNHEMIQGFDEAFEP
ncbi:MAG: hypothetical protein JNJ57_21650, partial [Saprospiraceae bacterium]|nr:hypothetical protein [Saprospiraceae bacterium]